MGNIWQNNSQLLLVKFKFDDLNAAHALIQTGELLMWQSSPNQQIKKNRQSFPLYSSTSIIAIVSNTKFHIFGPIHIIFGYLKESSLHISISLQVPILDYLLESHLAVLWSLF